MSRLTHYWLTTRRADPGRDMSCAFHVIQDSATRVPGQYVLREQHQLPIRENHLPIFGHDTKPITITIES
jgi:hypothetical protein